MAVSEFDQVNRTALERVALVSETNGVYKIVLRPGCALDELELALLPILPVESARISRSAPGPLTYQRNVARLNEGVKPVVDVEAISRCSEVGWAGPQQERNSRAALLSCSVRLPRLQIMR